MMKAPGPQLLYYDTNSVIYVSRPGDRESERGEILGEWSSELKLDEYITRFVSDGPKVHAYEANSGKNVMKCEGPTQSACAGDISAWDGENYVKSGENLDLLEKLFIEQGSKQFRVYPDFIKKEAKSHSVIIDHNEKAAENIRSTDFIAWLYDCTVRNYILEGCSDFQTSSSILDGTGFQIPYSISGLRLYFEGLYRFPNTLQYIGRKIFSRWDFSFQITLIFSPWRIYTAWIKVAYSSDIGINYYRNKWTKAKGAYCDNTIGDLILIMS